MDNTESPLRAPVRHSTFALAVVLVLAPLVRAEVPDRLRIDLPGPYPDWSAVEPVAPPDVREDASPTSSPRSTSPQPTRRMARGTPSSISGGSRTR